MKLLIVVDYQKDFVDGTLGFPGAKELDEKILTKIKEYEANGDKVIYTFDTHFDDYLETQEGRNLPIEHCISGTDGWELYGEVGKHYKKDLEFNKVHSFTKYTFGSHHLTRVLQPHDNVGVQLGYYNVESIELCGVVSYICVLSNAIIAKTANPEAEIIVDSELVAGPDQKLHNDCLNLMKNALQITVK